ncbi:MAG: sulfotransferase [Cyanobacteria bacterium P01_A01_bin.17]
MNMDYRLSIVCGLHRSGTTFVGKLLSRAAGQVIVEPSNPLWGVLGVPMWYPYLEQGQRSTLEVQQLYEDLVHFRRRWNRVPLKPVSLPSHLALRLFGGRQGLIWSRLKLQQWLNQLPENIFWKDPFVTFALGYLVQTYSSLVVCMVRHPGALYFSNHRLGWRFNVQEMRKQPHLMGKFGHTIPQEHWDLATPGSAACIAILWKLMAQVVHSVSERFDQILVVRHEDLCLNPSEITANICQHLQVPYTGEIQGYLEQTGQGKSAEPPPGVVHSFRRDRDALINNWRQKIALEDAAMMQEIIGNDLHTFYPAW